MKEKEIVSIPFVAHESDMNRMERINKRIGIIAITELVVILVMFIGIMVYFYLPSEEIIYEEPQSSENITQNNENGNNNYIGNDGDIINGKSKD